MLRIIGLSVVLWVTASTIIITSPAVTPFIDNSVPYYYSNFGEVPYGKSLTFELKVVSSNLCELTNVTHL